jgi:hypothetical protein
MIEVTPNLELRTVEVQVNIPGSTSENSFSVTYNSGRVQTITYETGKVKTFSYTGDLLTSITTIYEGSTILKTFSYDDEDNLVSAEVTYS